MDRFREIELRIAARKMALELYNKKCLDAIRSVIHGKNVTASIEENITRIKTKYKHCNIKSYAYYCGDMLRLYAYRGHGDKEVDLTGKKAEQKIIDLLDIEEREAVKRAL